MKCKLQLKILLWNLEIKAQLSGPSSELDHVSVCHQQAPPLQLIRISGDEWDSESLEKPVTDWPRHSATALGFRAWTYWKKASGGSGPVVEEAAPGGSDGGFFSLLYFSVAHKSVSDLQQRQGDLPPTSTCWLCCIRISRWKNFLTRGSTREEVPGERRSVFGGKWDRWTLA